MTTWVNGIESDSILNTDRSFQYGDGCFSTILTMNGQLHLWGRHLQRLRMTLDRLKIAQPNWEQVQWWLNNAILDAPKAGIKIHISRGSGGRGYSVRGFHTPLVTISNFSYPEQYLMLSQQGIRLGICSSPLGINPLLAGLKHNNRLEQVLLKAEMETLDYTDGIALDIHGNVIETTMANVFWARSGTIYTSKLTNSGVAGVMRAQVIDDLTLLSIEVVEGYFSIDSLLNADEVFITNAIMQVVPVIAIRDQDYDIGSITRRLQEKAIS
ncbi:aminodeoxychorismate lyase [Vibrio sp.]|nr:aminodeoxychorismate lyase [Vibrio sp.]